MEGPLYNAEDVKQQNPEEIVIGKENVNIMMEDIKKRLSPFENQVLDAYLDGADYIQIAEMTGRQPKSIDNALQRIRNKIHGMKW